MSLNLIADPWIPVLYKTGERNIIAPWQVADPDLLRPDWPRADLNIACLELLIGLVFLADPPENRRDWRNRQSPDPERLKARLAPFSPAFNLLGDGPRFMQDFEALKGDPNPPDMLFIDSAGGNTIRNNADLTVKRGRYAGLDLPMAAMALYTLQAHAPSGGAGNRTSMRGGGPMVTLIEPGEGLWPLIWANVPDGRPTERVDVLPWMSPAHTSNKGEQVFEHQAHPAEAFFGTPRRLRLVEEGSSVTGVVQRPYGANYAGWIHPLSPYYRMKEGAELLPLHPKAGLFGYRHWLGVAAAVKDGKDLKRRAKVVDLWHGRSGGRKADVIVAGWAMDNMKALDFTFSMPPLIDLPDEAADLFSGMVQAAEEVSRRLVGSLTPILADGTARDALREAFFIETQVHFERLVGQLQGGRAPHEVAVDWRSAMRDVALELFDSAALPGLDQRKIERTADIVNARRELSSLLRGYGKAGAVLCNLLDLEPPESKKSEGK